MIFFRTIREILLLSRYFIWSVVGGGLLLLGTLGSYYMIQVTGMYGASIVTGIALLLGGSGIVLPAIEPNWIDFLYVQALFSLSMWEFGMDILL